LRLVRQSNIFIGFIGKIFLGWRRIIVTALNSIDKAIVRGFSTHIAKASFVGAPRIRCCL